MAATGVPSSSDVLTLCPTKGVLTAKVLWCTSSAPRKQAQQHCEALSATTSSALGHSAWVEAYPARPIGRPEGLGVAAGRRGRRAQRSPVPCITALTSEASDARRSVAVQSVAVCLRMQGGGGGGGLGLCGAATGRTAQGIADQSARRQLEGCERECVDACAHVRARACVRAWMRALV
jgi:hypothetical protein